MIRILKEAETNRGEIFAREDPVDSVEDKLIYCLIKSQSAAVNA